MANISRTPHSVVAREMPKPATAAGKARSALSVSNCPISRERAAPIASRTPISRCRAMARASIILATLAQAISSTRPKPIMMGDKAAITIGSRGMAVALERRIAPAAFSGSGRLAVRCRAQIARAASAWRRLKPCRSLPTMPMRSGCFEPKRLGPSSNWGAMLKGAQKSKGTSLSPVKPARATPTTSSG